MNQALLPYGVSQEIQAPNLIRSFCFPMILTEKQKRLLHGVLNLGHEIRERAVEQRIADREKNRLMREAGEKPAYLSLIEQRKLIAVWMKTESRFSLIHSQVAQDLCARIDKADKQWLKGFKTGDRRAKPARHQDRKFFRSITYPQYGNGVRLSSGKIWFSKLGTFRLHDYQKITGTKKTVSIVWKQGKFWAVFTAEQAAKDWFPPAKEWTEKPTVAGDFGLKSLLTLSDGVVFDPPRRLEEAFQKLRTIQKSVSRKFEARKAAWEVDQELLKMQGKATTALREYPRSARLVADIRRLAKAHTKVERCRGYDHAKIASVLSCEFSQVALEDHGAQFMIRNRRLAKSASDRALSSLKSRIKSTLSAERVLLVSTTDAIGGGNSQTCTCSATVRKELKDRIHTCAFCGRTGDRDVVAADRAHLRAFGRLTQVRGQRICERGEHESEGVDRHLGEPNPSGNGFGMLVEAQTSQAYLAIEITMGGKPTLEDKTVLVQTESKLLAL